MAAVTAAVPNTASNFHVRPTWHLRHQQRCHDKQAQHSCHRSGTPALVLTRRCDHGVSRTAGCACPRECVRGSCAAARVDERSTRLSAGRRRARYYDRKAVSVTAQHTQHARATVATAQPGVTKLGFAGLGIMGIPMAQNLVKAGYEVHVWNRNPTKALQLAETVNVKVTSSPQALAQATDITFAMLADPTAALGVALGNDGIASGLSPGKGYVDVSTVDAATSTAIAQGIRETGALFLEAPVSGSKKPAEDGKLIFLTAGDEDLYKAVSNPLSAMGKASFFLGEVGAGSNMKLVVNMIMGSMMVAFAEGMTLAERSGLKREDLLEVLNLGAIAAPMFAMKGPSMIKGQFPPAFPLKHQQKDMRLALALGEEQLLAMPVAAAANGQYLKGRSVGYDDLDFSAVLQVIMASAASKTDERN